MKGLTEVTFELDSLKLLTLSGEYRLCKEPLRNDILESSVTNGFTVI